MIWKPLDIIGCYVAYVPAHQDVRGGFVKPFQLSQVEQVLPDFVAREIYLSRSTKGVLRGLHYQKPPHDHHKLVAVLNGTILDVLVDIRSGPGFGKVAQIELSFGDVVPIVAIPSGVAHGFLTLSDHCELMYAVTSEHSPNHDAGILWSSVGIDWPTQKPVLSDRDKRHPELSARLAIG